MKKWISRCVRSCTKSTLCNLGAVGGVQWALSIHSTYLKEPITEHEIKLECMNAIQNMYAKCAPHTSDRCIQCSSILYVRKTITSIITSRYTMKCGESLCVPHLPVQWMCVSIVSTIIHVKMHTQERGIFCCHESPNFKTQKLK